MLFGQKVHPLNFEYGTTLTLEDDRIRIAGASFHARISCQEIGGFCIRVQFDNARVTDKRNYSEGIVEAYREGRPIRPRVDGEVAVLEGDTRLEIGAARLAISLATGAVFETTRDGIGFNGEKFTLNFQVSDASGFYGFGERTGGFNKRGASLDFWNVDVVAVFPHDYARDDYDPSYVAIPLAIVKTGDLFSGLYFDNPGRAIIDVERIRGGQLTYQAMSGNTDVYFIAGPSLGDVVRHFAELTGRAEVPPLWSMGYHQCRWGYEKEADFLGLQERFAHFDIPVSAFWYDIDYMDDYRVFTWDPLDFPAPARLNNHLKEAGIRTVTIVDPGVKLDPGYSVYDTGKQQGIFCKTVSGMDYVGRVWPGDSVFPDFSRESARTWWAEWMTRFVQESAIDGVWLDMNDPATGYSAADDMRFEAGTVAHWAYHNQYGHFMAKASREAFDTIDANGRPFLLTRSGFAGSQRYSAIWNGDNVSNWQHLRMSIPCTINLGLSGVAFNGPDVGGFMGHTTEELLVRWYQAGFLFPFFRNHSMEKSKNQEPWAFGPGALGYIRETIRTRYRLLPYLYQCFFSHYLAGDPVLRPLLYEFDGAEFENLNDQFLVGGGIMIAPIVFGEGEGQEVWVGDASCQLRHIVFPPGWWFDLNRGDWIAGGQVHPYAAALGEVPIFVRDGTMVPYYNGPLRNSHVDLSEIELHIFARQGAAQLTYYIDDQETRNYQKGHYNTARITARMQNQALRLNIEEEGGYPGATVAFHPVLYGGESVASVVIDSGGQTGVRNLEASTREWICKKISVRA